MRGARIPWFELVLLAIGFAVLALLGGLQHHDTTPAAPTNSSFDTAGGGYAAWFELLQREGVAVQRFQQRPAFLDRSIDTLIVADADGLNDVAAMYSAADAAALDRWVNDGGRVVFLRGGFSVERAEQQVLPKLEVKAGKISARPYVSPEVAKYGVTHLAAAFDRELPVRSRFNTLLAKPGRILIARYAVGKGIVDEVYAREPFENANLLKADAARLAYFLGSPNKAHGIVAFDEGLHGYMVPLHWWDALPRNFVIAVLLSMVVLALALAGAAIRLGPPLVPEPDRQATSSEYVDAVAALLQRRGAIAYAISAATEATRRAVTAIGPVAAGESVETNLRELERLAQMPQPSERNLIDALARSYAIRKDLLVYGRTG